MRYPRTYARCFECGWTGVRTIRSARGYEHELIIHWMEIHLEKKK